MRSCRSLPRAASRSTTSWMSRTAYGPGPSSYACGAAFREPAQATASIATARARRRMESSSGGRPRFLEPETGGRVALGGHLLPSPAAVWRSGFQAGCAFFVVLALAAAPALAGVLEPLPPQPDGVPWPTLDWAVRDAGSDVDRAALADAV